MDLTEPRVAPQTSAHSAERTVLRAVGDVRRRLGLQRGLEALGRWLSYGAAGLLVLAILDRLLAPGWSSLAVLGGLAALLLLPSLAAALSAAKRIRPEAAARRIDAALALEERVLTAYYAVDALKRPQERAWAEVVIEDAAEKLRGVDPRRLLPLDPPKSLFGALAGFVLAFGAVSLLPSFDLFGFEARRREEAALKRALEEERLALERRLAELEAHARLEEAKEAAKRIAELRRRLAAPPAKPASSPEDPRKSEAARLREELKRLDEALTSKDARALRTAGEALRALRLREFDAARRLAEALKAGDYTGALEELRNLGKRAGKALEEAQAGAPESAARAREALAGLAGDVEKLARKLESLPEGTIPEDLARKLEKLRDLLERLARESSVSKAELDGAFREAALSLEDLRELAKELEYLEREALALENTLERLERLSVCPQCGTPRCPDCGGKRCACPDPQPGGT